MNVEAIATQGPARICKALGDETRLRIFALLAHGELCVCHLEEALQLSQPNASKHLAILRNAGVVDSRREGNWIYYRLARQSDDGCRRLIRALVAGYAGDPALRRDVARLRSSKGPTACR